MGNWFEDQMEGIGTKILSSETINSQKQQGITEIIISFDGNFYKNLFCGFGTAIYENGSEYVGNWKNSERNGCGRLNFTQNYYYFGNFIEGSFHGRGTLRNVIEDNDDIIFNNNDNNFQVTSIIQNYGGEFIGDFKHGKANGFGILTIGLQIFKGRYINDKLTQTFSE